MARIIVTTLMYLLVAFGVVFVAAFVRALFEMAPLLLGV